LYTVVLIVAGFHLLLTAVSPPSFNPLTMSQPEDPWADAGLWLLTWTLAFATGCYAYRIWTWRAKHLWFLIIV
jgi:hypothetical protein